MRRRTTCCLTASLWMLLTASAGAETLTIDSPMSPPGWALLERELLRANEAACQEFFETYFDERGWLKCVERWGGDDGPDDAIETMLHWPILHACGADDIDPADLQATPGRVICGSTRPPRPSTSRWPATACTTVSSP